MNTDLETAGLDPVTDTRRIEVRIEEVASLISDIPLSQSHTPFNPPRFWSYFQCLYVCGYDAHRLSVLFQT